MFLRIKSILFVLSMLCMPAFKAQEASGLVGRNRNMKSNKALKSTKSPKARKSPKTSTPSQSPSDSPSGSPSSEPTITCPTDTYFDNGECKKCNNLDEVIRNNECVVYTDAIFDVDIKKGTIPTEIGLLTHRTRLDLEVKQLTGTIPSEIGKLVGLRTVKLYGNGLTGMIPPEMGELTKLTFLQLYNNKLEGPIPTKFDELCNRIFRCTLIAVDGTNDFDEPTVR